MKIRKATIEDVNIIAKYNYNLALETEEKVLNMDTVTKGVEAILRDSTKGIYHVCEIEGQVVGGEMEHSYGFKVYMLIRSLEEKVYLKTYINI